MGAPIRLKMYALSLCKNNKRNDKTEYEKIESDFSSSSDSRKDESIDVTQRFDEDFLQAPLAEQEKFKLRHLLKLKHGKIGIMLVKLIKLKREQLCLTKLIVGRKVNETAVTNHIEQ